MQGALQEAGVAMVEPQHLRGDLSVHGGKQFDYAYAMAAPVDHLFPTDVVLINTMLILTLKQCNPHMQNTKKKSDVYFTRSLSSTDARIALTLTSFIIFSVLLYHCLMRTRTWTLF